MPDPRVLDDHSEAAYRRILELEGEEAGDIPAQVKEIHWRVKRGFDLMQVSMPDPIYPMIVEMARHVKAKPKSKADKKE